MIGLIGIATGLAFAAAAALLTLFFVTNDVRYDRLAEWTFVVFAALAIVLALVVQQRLGGSSSLTILVTILGIAGVAVVGLLEGLSALGRIDFERFGGLAALGFAGWLGWVAGVSLIGLASGLLPAGPSWLGILAVIGGILVVGRFALDRAVIQSQRVPGRVEMLPLVAVFVALVAWLVWLGGTA